MKRLTPSTSSRVFAFVLPIAVFLVYYYTNPTRTSPYDYTLRIAGALLRGELGDRTEPPGALNEMIPLNETHYSAFPLGSVVTMMPVAVLRALDLVVDFPGAALAGVSAGTTGVFFWLLSGRYRPPFARRCVLTCFPLLGTWMWANLPYGGAWQIALGVAVAAQAGALYFTLQRFRPFAAGLCFALAFGNRTEVILVAPLFYDLVRRQSARGRGLAWGWTSAAAIRFSAAPLVLGIATLAYNYARFDSVTDFGYARIPGVLEERWYEHGIFSFHAIRGNVQEMLLTPWKSVPEFPYLVPTGFGGSIFLSSPYLVYLFRRGARDATLKSLAWVAVGVLTFALWLHGNPGGWQFSYRYAMVLLPWMFVVLQENSPDRVSRLEAALLLTSMVINGYAAWLFLRTSYVQP
jgi:hypothetical protein